MFSFLKKCSSSKPRDLAPISSCNIVIPSTTPKMTFKLKTLFRKGAQGGHDPIKGNEIQVKTNVGASNLTVLATDHEFLGSMQLMFEALHEPSVLDAWRNIVFGLVPRMVAASSTMTLIGNGEQAPTKMLIGPTEALEGSIIPLPNFHVPLEIICPDFQELVEEYNVPPDQQKLDFRSVSFLGSGSTCQVFQVQERLTKLTFALKVVPKDHVMPDYQLEKLKQEVAIHEKLSDSLWFSFLATSWYDDRNYYMAQDICPTDLESVLRKCGKMDRKQVKFYAGELFTGLPELHARGVIHRDIKPANILIGRDGHVVLSDFGSAKDFGEAPTQEERIYLPYWAWRRDDDEDTPPRHPKELHFISNKITGSAPYMSPEASYGWYHSFGSDYWSLGVVVYRMVTGRLPWFFNPNTDPQCIDCGTPQRSIRRRIKDDPVPWLPEDDVDDDTKDFIERCLSVVSETEIPYHPFFKDIDWELMHARQVTPPMIPTDIGHAHAQPSQVVFAGSQFPILGQEDEDKLEFNYMSIDAQLRLRSIFMTSSQSSTPSSESNPSPTLTPDSPAIPSSTPGTTIDDIPLSVEWERTCINSPSRHPHGPGSPRLPQVAHQDGFAPSSSPPPSISSPSSLSSHSSSHPAHPHANGSGIWQRLKSIFGGFTLRRK